MTERESPARKRPRRCPWATVAGVLILSGTFCSRHPRVQYEIYPDVQLRETSGLRSSACRDSVELLLSDVWSSEFWHRNQQIRTEILNNEYGIFECRDRSEAEFKSRAYYRKTNDHQQVMLNKRLFRHFSVDRLRGFALTDMDRRIKATLVHELLHDIWFNILDDSLKEQFAAEADLFLAEVDLVHNKQDKLDFLSSAGYADPSILDFAPFAELLNLKDIYDRETLCGTELFAILGDRAFAGRILIPRRFRKYYYGVLSAAALDRTGR